MIKNIFIYFLFFGLLFFSSISNSKSNNKEKYEYLDLFGQVFDRVRSSYVEEVSDKELIEKAIDGMLTGLDPHSGYMNSEVWEEMKMDTEGKFGGLGIEITMEEGFVKVIAPIEDTPAFDAGVLAGDYIVQIDDTPVFGMNLNEAVELLRGKKGDPITVTISREGLEPFEITIIRDFIKIRSVKNEIFDNIGYLRITSFTEQTEEGLKESISSIQKELNNKEIGYILDLRSNPGGLLTQAIKVTDIFLTRGEIVSTRGREKKDIKRYRAKTGDKIDGKPLVIIIDGGSASASEIVAGALQDHRRAIVIGTKSFGKGSVQTIIPFKKNNEDVSGIRLTTARYYTPAGTSIQGKGITPDIIVEQGTFESSEYKRYSESDLKDSLDNEKNDIEEIKGNDELSAIEERLLKDFQLQRAIDLIQGLSLYKEYLEE
tara:strand:- start:125 stop:1414 length:1290 start_codon:yes stop_codon:yes gene_type:complete